MAYLSQMISLKIIVVRFCGSSLISGSVAPFRNRLRNPINNFENSSEWETDVIFKTSPIIEGHVKNHGPIVARLMSRFITGVGNKW
jgi:hypothetical protein